MRVLHVCSELFPILKTGGLADVTGALPTALNQYGAESRVLVPGFPDFMHKIENQQVITELEPRFGAHSLRIILGNIPNSDIQAYVIDAPGLFDRQGNPYADSEGHPYADNYRRFALLSWVASQLAAGLDQAWQPNIVHGHDWHAGLTAAYIKADEISHNRKLVGTVFTVHNLAYQGEFPAHVFNELGLPHYFFNQYGLEFYGQVSFLKAGLYFSDKITTVSPSYAKEIQGNEQGCGLNGLLESRAVDLSGILNGVDPKVWSPEQDINIAKNYSVKKVADKAVCRLALQEATGLKVQTETPIFTVVSRLTEQKGLNLILAGVMEIVNRGGQLALLGSGDKDMEIAFTALASEYPEQIAVKLGYDEKFAHQLIAGSDVIMVPSRFEPCGLTQLYGLAYGTLPLVRNVGGLADTVVDSSLENLADGIASGFVFDEFNQTAFNAAVRRAFALYGRKTEWKKVQKYAMQQNFSWNSAAEQYMELYNSIV